VFVFAGAATGLMGALNPLVTGVVLKLEASKTAEIDSRAIERAICSAQARVELFFCFFIELFGLNQFSCILRDLPGSGLWKSPDRLEKSRVRFRHQNAKSIDGRTGPSIIP
jgi:hypothetical protein